MRKINIVIWVWIGVLFVAFAAVSLMVIVGRNRQFFLKKKLAIGGMIIALTGFVVTGTACEPMCYEPVMDEDAWDPYADYDLGDSTDSGDADDSSIPDNRFSLTEPMQDDRVVVDLQGDRIISGTIEGRYGYAFSYALWSSETKHLSDDLEALDGTIDEQTEEFEIVIPDTTQTGVYELRFYDVVADGQRAGNHRAAFEVEIVDSSE